MSQPHLRDGFHLALHTARPSARKHPCPVCRAEVSETEATFPGYARVFVPASDIAWENDGNESVVTNLKLISFPECTSGAQTLTHMEIIAPSLGDDVETTGRLNVPCSVMRLITLSFAPGALSLRLPRLS